MCNWLCKHPAVYEDLSSGELANQFSLPDYTCLVSGNLRNSPRSNLRANFDANDEKLPRFNFLIGSNRPVVHGY